MTILFSSSIDPIVPPCCGADGGLDISAAIELQASMMLLITRRIVSIGRTLEICLHKFRVWPAQQRPAANIISPALVALKSFRI